MRSFIIWLSLLATGAGALSTSASYTDLEIPTKIPAYPATTPNPVARAVRQPVTETLTLPVTVIDCGEKPCTVTQTLTNTITNTITNTVTEKTTETSTNTVTETITYPGSAIKTETIPETVTSTTTETVSLSGSARPTTITNTATVTSIQTQTVTQTVGATATTTLTTTISIPASTVTDISSTTITVGQSTTTVTSTSTLTAGESTVTLPGSTVTVPGETVTLPISTILTVSTTRVDSTIIRTETVPGAVSTIPASTITSVSTIPASTVKLPGGTSIIPGSTKEILVRYPASTVTLPGTTKTITVTVTPSSRDSILAPEPTSTKTQGSGSPVTLSVSVCPTLISNPTYTPLSKLPSDYTWGCPPGRLCFPSRTGNRSGCNVEAGLPDEDYICAPSDCIPAPRLILNQSWEFDTEGQYFNYSRDYYNLNPEKFGLKYDIFRTQDEHNAIQGKRDLSSLQDLSPSRLATETLVRRDLSDIPGVCYNDCNNAALEQQATGKRPELCKSDSAYSLDLENCKTCIRHHESPSSDGFLSSLLPSFAQFLNYCSDLPVSATQATAEATSSSPATTAKSSGTENDRTTTESEETSIIPGLSSGIIFLTTAVEVTKTTGSDIATKTLSIASSVGGSTSAGSFNSESKATTAFTTILGSANTLSSFTMIGSESIASLRSQGWSCVDGSHGQSKLVSNSTMVECRTMIYEGSNDVSPITTTGIGSSDTTATPGNSTGDQSRPTSSQFLNIATKRTKLPDTNFLGLFLVLLAYLV